jgi:Flp pilus assembly protein CpaB
VLASAALPPDVAGDAGEVVGARLSVPLRSGSPVAPASLVGPGLLTGSPPGTVAVPVRPSDAETVSLLSPGQLVDVVLSTGNGYEQPVESAVIASALPVLWTGDTAPDGGWLGGESPAGMVVLAASAAESAVLAGAASRGRIFLVLVAG